MAKVEILNVCKDIIASYEITERNTDFNITDELIRVLQVNAVILYVTDEIRFTL